MKKQVITDKAPKAIGPYSQAIIEGDTLYASGQIPLDPQTGEIVKGGIEAQTERVMKNVGAVLESAGLGFDDVVKTTVFLTDLKDFDAVNKIYGKYFNPPHPARSCVQVAALPKDAMIEAEVVAKLK